MYDQCELCEQSILVCTCLRCMECEELFREEDHQNFAENRFGEVTCEKCFADFLDNSVTIGMEPVDDEGPYNDVPSKGGYVFWHSRDRDVVLIGPFPSLTAARAWYNSYGAKLGCSPMLTDLRAPADTYHGLWGLYPEEEK